MFPYNVSLQPIVLNSYRLSPNYFSRIGLPSKIDIFKVKKNFRMLKQKTSSRMCLEKGTVWFRTLIDWDWLRLLNEQNMHGL